MQWYLWRGGQTHGPYDEQTVKSWLESGELLPQDLLSKDGGEWMGIELVRTVFSPGSTYVNKTPVNADPFGKSATAAPQPMVAPLYTPPQAGIYPAQAAPVYTPYPAVNQQNYSNVPCQGKRKHGCALGCLSVFLVFAMVAGLGGYFVMNRDSANIKFGSKQKLTQTEITSLGGDIEFLPDGEGSPAAKLTVPENAYEKQTKFTVSTTEIKEHNLGEYFDPITPLISIDNKHEYASEYMVLTVPISIKDDEFAMLFYYDRKKGTLEALPLVELTNNSITVATEHFSDVVGTKVKKSELQDLDIDTGFEPGYDDWQFTNYGSWIEPSGHCAGQSITAMWYYYEKHIGANERRLYGRYDNNNYGNGTIDFWQDDSWGYRFASTIQRKIDWDGILFTASGLLTKLGDNVTFNAFAYSMLLTQSPQFTGIYHYDAKGEIAGGHAIVAYKIKDNVIHVADPNYPGVSGRTIVYDEAKNVFKPYSSAANAKEIAAGEGELYTGINYLAVSSMVGWGLVGQEYEKLLEKKAGDDLFLPYTLERLTAVNPDTGAETWEACPDEIETDLEKTGKVHTNYAGKLVLRMKCNYNDVYATRYEGTIRKTNAEITGGDGIVKYVIDLKKGINDIGVLVEAPKSGTREYVDFRRVKVTYESVDLSGLWRGEMNVTEAGPFINFVVDWISRILVTFSQAFDEPMDMATARQAAENAIVFENQDIAMTMQISRESPDDDVNYKAFVSYVGSDGLPYEYETKFKYKGGEMEFSLYDAASASRFKFTGTLAGNDVLSGTYTVNVWGGLIRNAFSGEWTVRLENNE
jgi:hypothetical protein